MERLLRLLTYAALVYELHLALDAWHSRRLDSELRALCDPARRG